MSYAASIAGSTSAVLIAQAKAVLEVRRDRRLLAATRAGAAGILRWA